MANRIIVEHTLEDAGKTTRKARRSVTVNAVESPLGWLYRHGHLTIRQFDAGEQLRSDWERAALSPSVTMRWDPSPRGRHCGPRGAGMTVSEQAEGARDRFDAALRSAGSGMADILWRVVCAGEGMREAETALGWPARAGKLVLGMALDRVADHYRLPLGRCDP